MWYALFLVYIQGVGTITITPSDFYTEDSCYTYAVEIIDTYQVLIEEYQLEESVAYGNCFYDKKEKKV